MVIHFFQAGRVYLVVEAISFNLQAQSSNSPCIIVKTVKLLKNTIYTLNFAGLYSSKRFTLHSLQNLTAKQPVEAKFYLYKRFSDVNFSYQFDKYYCINYQFFHCTCVLRQNFLRICRAISLVTAPGQHSFFRSNLAAVASC